MNSDAALLLETVQFAAEKHRNQKRKDPEETPYINHPIGRCVFTVVWCIHGLYVNPWSLSLLSLKEKEKKVSDV